MIRHNFTAKHHVSATYLSLVGVAGLRINALIVNDILIRIVNIASLASVIAIGYCRRVYGGPGRYVYSHAVSSFLITV